MTLLESAPQSPPSTFRLAIASDLHAYSSSELKGGDPPSHLEVLNSDISPTTNPIFGLRELIDKKTLKADIIACPGDLGDRASPEGIQFAWQKICEVGGWLGARQAVATTGNHDVDSRHKGQHVDPNQLVKDLDPPYPTRDEAQNDHYFARDFVMIEEEHYRVVLLNSSAHHGTRKHEENHGLITPQTLAKLKAALGQRNEKLLSMLICHHHPHHHSELKLGSEDLMKDGQLLLDLLGSSGTRPWLVIHGHKHHPKITYAAGGTCSPIVFAAGSLSAILLRELQTATRNQFHILTVNYGHLKTCGLVGTVDSWYWAYGEGWLPSNPSSGLPSRCGFGFRGDLRQLGENIAQTLSTGHMLWSELLQSFPQLEFLLPQDFVLLRELLRDSYAVGIHEEEGLPYQIGRR